MSIVVIFLLIICLLYYFIHPFNHETQKPQSIGYQYPAPLQLNTKDPRSLKTSTTLSKNSLWIIREKSGIQARSKPFQNAPKTTYLSFSTILDGGELVIQSEKNNITFLYLSIHYPVEGWIYLTKWRSEEGKRRNLQLDRLSAVPLTLPAEPIPEIQPQTNLIKEAKALCADKSIYQSDRDYPGNDLTGGNNPLALKTVQQCCEECFHNPFCFSWSFTKEKDCWLKGDPKQQEPRENKGIVSGKLPPKALLNRPKVDPDSILKKNQASSSSSSALFTPTLTSNHQVCCNKSSVAITLTSFEFFAYNSATDQVIPARSNKPQQPQQLLLLPSIITREKERSLSSSSYQLKSLLLTGNWDEQWPIGNGIFGGFVHGTLQYEVNPFSIHNFFLLKPNPNPNRNQKDAKELNGKITFQDARQEYLEGHFQKSNKILLTFARKHSLGMFSYLFDFTLFFSLFPLRFTSFPEEQVPEISITNPQFQGPNAPKLPPRVIPIAASLPGRKGRIERIRSHVSQNIPTHLKPLDEQETQGPMKQVDPKASFVPFQHILLSESQLDMAAGISFASFIHRYSIPSNDEDPQQRQQQQAANNGSNRFSSNYFDDYHYREWFASEKDNLIIGKYQCKTISSPSPMKNSNKERKNCLNIGFEISRETNGPDKIFQLLTVDSAINYIHNQVLDPILQKEFSSIVNNNNNNNSNNNAGENNGNSNLLMKAFLEKSFVLNFQVQSLNDNVVPLTNAFVLLYCDGKEFLYQSNEAQHENNHKVNQKKGPFIPNADIIHLFLCNEANELKIFILMEKIPNLGKSRDEIIKMNKDYAAYPATSTNSLQFHLQKNFLSFLQKGSNKIRSNHISLFQERMLQSTGIDLHFDTPSTDDNSLLPKQRNQRRIVTGGGGYGTIEVCDNLPDNIYSFHLFGKTCQDPLITIPQQQQQNERATRGKSMKEAQLAVQLYQFGKYLFQSSASQSNPNLQGLWCDGLNAAWNGDYHLNINLQMNYWHLFTSFLRNPSTAQQQQNDFFLPLLTFMEELMVRGSMIAKEMYNIPANKKNVVIAATRNYQEEIPWVAHGFTDSTLTSFPNGEMQWALCETCGAWMANHLFDYFMFQSITPQGDSSSNEFVLIAKRVLPIYRGILLFFKDYLFKSSTSDGDYWVHSGPTTSPENSYLLKLNGESVQSIVLSPSIDISILRQTSNIWNLLLGLLIANEKTKNLVSTKDIELGKEFEELIFHFSNHAIPVVDENHHTTSNEAAPLLKEYPDNYFQVTPVPPTTPLDASSQPKPGGKQRALNLPAVVEESVQNHPEIPPLSPPIPVADAANPNEFNGIGENQFNLFPLPPPMDANMIQGNPDAPDGVDTANHNAKMPPPLNYEEIFRIGKKPRQQAPVRRNLLTAKEEVFAEAIIDESIDYGHRHYSLMHWLFPNNFLPFYSPSQPSQSSKGADLYAAALRTILNKKKHKGSHTNWSLVWELILLARLSNYDQLLTTNPNANTKSSTIASIDIHEEIFQSFQRFFSSFLTNNFLTLHPALDKIENVLPSSSVFLTDKDAQIRPRPPLQQPQPKLVTYSCETCYRERTISPETRRAMKFSIYSSLYFPDPSTAASSSTFQSMGSRRLPQQSHSIVDDLLNELAEDRGFLTRFEDKFQIDGNFGYLKAIQEQLVQSFLPNLLHILPLPRHFLLTSVGSEGGELRGFPLQGNSQLLWLRWKAPPSPSSSVMIEEMWLEVDLTHFWWGKELLREKKDRPGFFEFSSSPSRTAAEIFLIAPNALTVSDEISLPSTSSTGEVPNNALKNKRNGKKMNGLGIVAFQSSLPRCVIEKTEIISSSDTSSDYVSVISRGKSMLRMTFPLNNPINQKKCVIAFH